MKPRFSLRVLLIGTACLAMLCHWRDRPRRVADRFVAAFNAKDMEGVEALFDPVIACGTIFPFVVRNGEFTAVRASQSLGEWFRGECRVEFHRMGAWLNEGYATASALGISGWNRYEPCEPKGVSSTASRGRLKVGRRQGAG